VAFLGLAKNVGKTTALVSVLAQLSARGVCAGCTSAGRDGESFDAITGEPKPRFRLARGQILASAASTFRSGSGFSPPVAVLAQETRLGSIEIRRCEADADVEVIGPATAAGVAEACAALEAAGASIVLLDGAMGRRAFASSRVSDGIVLSAGLAAGGSITAAVEAARLASELICLGSPAVGRPVRDVAGAVTDELLADGPPAENGSVLAAEDFASIFLSPGIRKLLGELGVALAVRRPARLLAVTANPAAPGGRAVEAGKFLEALSAALPGIPVFDVVAGLCAGLIL
jgi:hypothetical protein